MIKISKITNVEFAPMTQGDLEFRVNSRFTPSIPEKRFVVISAEEARELYFPTKDDSTNVYVIIGGQKGDEGKGMAEELVTICDPAVGWTLSPNSTSNAGKGVHTKDEQGRDVKVSLHLCPATIVDPHMKGYIGREVRVNPFSLEEEILDFHAKTGRNKLGENYHLKVDSNACLVVPTERADDVVCKKNAMGSTVTGATSSARDAAGKMAPTIEDVLYDPEQFIKQVNFQIREFEDRIKHDKEFAAMGIDSMYKLGCALGLEVVYKQNKRLEALAKKLSSAEKIFFTQSDPAQYLLEQFSAIIKKGLFYTGDCIAEINSLIEKGMPGGIEGVQSCLLSGPVRYSKNRTAAGTHGSATIGDSGLSSDRIRYRKVLAFKFGNTSVGGNDRTMSGFIEQDALSELEVRTQDGERICFEKPEALKRFLTHDEIVQAFHEVTESFFNAIQNGYSVRNSKVRVKGIDLDMSLAEARALFTSYRWNEKGETSGRARICRFDDMVETGVVYKFEGKPLQIRNAIDRAMDLPSLGIVTAYEVVGEYGGYKKGDIILPGMPLRQEHLTVKGCVPIIDFLPRWKSFNADGTNELRPGSELDRDMCRYLTLASAGGKVVAIGLGPKLENKFYVKEL
jgi:adenylosuccinate synthase